MQLAPTEIQYPYLIFTAYSDPISPNRNRLYVFSPEFPALETCS
jgi:hypothetical protein